MESAIIYYAGNPTTGYVNAILQATSLAAGSPVPFGSLSQMTQIMAGQKQAEGWKSGSVTCGRL